MSAADAIRAFFRQYRLEDKINEAKLRSVCDRVLGPVISKQVTQISFRNHTVSISVKSAALKQELEYQKSLIIENINVEMKKEIVKEVIIK